MYVIAWVQNVPHSLMCFDMNSMLEVLDFFFFLVGKGGGYGLFEESGQFSKSVLLDVNLKVDIHLQFQQKLPQCDQSHISTIMPSLLQLYPLNGEPKCILFLSCFWQICG